MSEEEDTREFSSPTCNIEYILGPIPDTVTKHTMPDSQIIFLAILGVGGVGKAFLPQLSHLQNRLASQTPAIDLRLILARRSNKQVLTERYNGLDPSTIIQTLDESKKPFLDFDEILDFLSNAPGKVVLVDNTASLDLGKQYPKVLKRGISVVTPNKKAFSDTDKLWQSIFSAASSGNSHIFHEASCGAGLPIISTLKELLETGDEVTKIEGVFSGTMSFLFNSFMPVGGGGGNFSDEVTKAKELGYTEPDPRDDLNGLDVARKLTILARIVGLQIESPTSFPVQSLIPSALESCSSGDEFMEKLPQHDDEMVKVKEGAEKKGKVLRYVGSIDVTSKSVKVGLEEFAPDHPIAALKGSDNIINFYTKRYGNNPLIIQGAGAGGEVTAMGVTGDLIKVVRLLQGR